MWRAENPAADDYPNHVAALKEALADMEAGDHGMPLEQFDAKFRQRHSVVVPAARIVLAAQTRARSNLPVVR